MRLNWQSSANMNWTRNEDQFVNTKSKLIKKLKDNKVERIAFERGRVGIHSLSAAAIEEVVITDGETKPIRISVLMNNSSGIYQVDGLLKAKLRGSGLEPYVEVIAHIDTEAEKRLVPLYELDL